MRPTPSLTEALTRSSFPEKASRMTNQTAYRGFVVPILATVTIVIGLITGGVAVWLGVSVGDNNADTTAEQAASSSVPSTTTSTVAPTPTSEAPTVVSEPEQLDVPPEVSTPVAPQPAQLREPSTFVFPVKSQDTHYDPSHHDYPAADMFSQCGSPVVAVTDGRVEEVETADTWDSSNPDGGTKSGLMVALVDSRGVLYYGSHMASVSVEVGDVLAAGDQIGTVGETGNAAGTGCHLHFGLSPACRTGWENRRGLVSPQPFLNAWRSGEARDPLEEVKAISCG